MSKAAAGATSGAPAVLGQSSTLRINKTRKDGSAELRAAGVPEVSPAAGFLEALRLRGFDFFCGVADSTIASLIGELGKDYLSATREDLAVGMASGAYLSGRRPAVLMQNSGLGCCLNALTSLSILYRIPLLLIVGYRGWQGKDAPEHLVMGAHCEQLLREVGIPVFVPEQSRADEAVTEADQALRRERVPAAIFIRPGVL